jgi:hypothetical protein
VERAANAALIEEMWADVVGSSAAAHSRILGLRGTVLLAEAEAGPWTQDLSAQRGRFSAEINRRFGSEVVTEMRFRQTTSPFPAARPGSAAVQRGAADERRGVEPAADEPALSPDELAAVDRAVAEIRDPEIREGARRAMMSQRRWQKRQKALGEKP